MAAVKLKITCRIEEVPIIGRFLLNSMTTDLADFTALSPLYNPTFLSNTTGKLQTVEALINPRQLTAELKVITLRMLTGRETLRDRINRLEIYINKATGLTIGKKDFGISSVRTKNNRGDVEGLIAALSYLLTNVAVPANMAALTLVGYGGIQHAAIDTIKNALGIDNTAQNAKVNERNNKVVANYGLINELWVILTDITKSGKAIYNNTAPDKAKNYTIAELKRRIRQEQLKQKLIGVIRSEERRVGKECRL